MATVSSLGLFPFCTTVEEAPTSFFVTYVVIPKQQAAKWFWRVKKWRSVFTASFKQGFPFASGTYTTTNAIVDAILGPWVKVDLGQPTTISTEKELVCSGSLFYFDLNYDSVTNAVINGGSFTGDEIITISPTTASPELLLKEVYDVGSENLAIGLSFNFIAFLPWAFISPYGSGVSTGTKSEGIVQVPIGFPPFETLSDATLLRKLPNAGQIDGVFFDLNAEDDVANASLIITPAEYWEYDPNDGGGPIYDKETGEQLRSFP